MSAQRSGRGKKKGSSGSDTSHVLEELAGRSERIAEWIAENPLPIFGVMGSILVVAAIWGLVSSSQQSAESEAANALATADGDYRAAMGAGPGQLEIPEPANPEAARAAREAAVARYTEVAESHAGQAAATVAILHKGALERDLGSYDEALATWQRAANESQGALRALALDRIAGLHEDAGRLDEAAAAYEEAAAIAEYPLRHQALAEAARCRAAAGQAEQAVDLFQRIEAEAPDLQLAPHISAQLRELRALRYE